MAYVSFWGDTLRVSEGGVARVPKTAMKPRQHGDLVMPANPGPMLNTLLCKTFRRSRFASHGGR